MSIRYIYFTIILIVFLGLSGTVPVYAATTGKVESTEQSSVNKLVNSSTESDEPVTESLKSERLEDNPPSVYTQKNVKDRKAMSSRAGWDTEPDLRKASPAAQAEARSLVNNAMKDQIYNKIKDRSLGYIKGSTIEWTGSALPTRYSQTQFDMITVLQGMTEVKMFFYITGPFAASTITALSTDGAIKLTYDAISGKGTLTRMKNKKTDVSSERLTISADISFESGVAELYRTALGSNVKFGVHNNIPETNVTSTIFFQEVNYLTQVVLEEPVALSAKTVSEGKLTINSTLPSTPEQYITVHSHMEGSKLNYQWVTKPDLTKVGIQTVKVKVTDQLDEYHQEQTLDLIVNVLGENLQSITTKDSELYVGQNWTRKDNFVGATDEDGKTVPWEDIRIQTGGADVDTSKPGVYNLKYNFEGKDKTTESVFKVTVKEDQTKLELKDVELYVGETFDPNAPFENVIDVDGKVLKAGDIESYYINGVLTKVIDTTQAGTYKIQIHYSPYENYWRYSKTITVTVKEPPITLTVPEFHTFGEMQLGKNEKLYWNKAEKIKVINDGNRKWQLSAKLLTSNNLDFPNYIRFKGQFFTKDEILIDTGDTTKTVTDELTTDKFIYVDYSDVKQLRKDVATLEWALTPSTKELIE